MEQSITGNIGNITGDVTEEEFDAACRKLERESKSQSVRICDLRRRLGWTTQEFDALLLELRDSGKIRLRHGDIKDFTKKDIRESFIDENSILRLTAVRV